MMPSNLTQREKQIRIIVGALVEGPGWLILVLRFVNILSGDAPWFVGGILVAAGLFLVLEGALGWSAARAMGIGRRE